MDVTTLELHALAWALVVEVTGTGWDQQSVWLRGTVPYLLAQGLLVGTEGSVLPHAFVDFTEQFRLPALTYEAFSVAYQLARESSMFNVTVVSCVPLPQRDHLREAKRAFHEKLVAERRRVAQEVVEHIEGVRDEHALELSLIARSQRQIALANNLFTKADPITGGRRRIRGPYGVILPKPFAPAAVVARQQNDAVAHANASYVTDDSAGIQYAPLGDVIHKLFNNVQLVASATYSTLLLEHCDALATPAGKRTLSTVWVLQPKLFPRSLSNAGRWFDCQGGVPTLQAVARWRTEQVAKVLAEPLLIRGSYIKITNVYVIGDNERLQLELGGCTGSATSRCYACFLPSPLFPFLPFNGHTRSLGTGALAFAALEEAQARLSMVENLGTIPQKTRDAIDVHIRALHGSMSYPPLYSIGATFPLERIKFSVPVLHDVGAVLLLLKKFLNTKLDAADRLLVKEYISVRERREEFSRWQDNYEELSDDWLYLPDLAAQLTSTLWASSPITPAGALRAQICALLLHFEISAWKPEEAATTYLHGLAAHLFPFLMDLADLGLVVLHFFEEAGERLTAVVREFVAHHSNFKDNLLSGARAFEAVTGALQMRNTNRRRRLTTEAPVFTNIAVAPCVLHKSAAHAETFEQMLTKVTAIGSVAPLICRHGELIILLVAVDTDDFTLACNCGEHELPPGPPFSKLDVHDWRSSVDAKSVTSLDAADYDIMALLVNSPFGGSPRFAVTPVLEQLLALQPKSARRKELGKLKVPELRDRCKAAGLPTVGNKDDLVDRLLEPRSEPLQVCLYHSITCTLTQHPGGSTSCPRFFGH
jgi:hypothetical protein